MKIQLTKEKAEEIFNNSLGEIKDDKSREFLKVHVPAVKSTCIILSENKNLDRDLLIIASWVHDIGYSINEKKHPEESLKLLEEKYGFYINETLKDCILNHGAKGIPKTNEGRIFQIADKISLFDKEILSLFLKNISNKDDFDYFKYLVSNALDFLRHLQEE